MADMHKSVCLRFLQARSMGCLTKQDYYGKGVRAPPFVGDGQVSVLVQVLVQDVQV